ncbi:hypothetical protein SARC_04096 [Sphaeroforma arctica JP610]|uniref:Uncharacterized protein n=1 Tax=Sphaeroforma arctica JP610 TaxID=667725 RepID=A0A0L0G624_9EUKA|nr:hypothetical protein SARC_04096 [Sphaeroforma arctica JP610]KNC83663.1 hypothetical protein SARC_04096 [Sphaeroforma arctica JP610]|eukprot:XP_014157565.1 hypothetical protein SARC_04096 [Sphaeroforma arctica JP610]
MPAIMEGGDDLDDGLMYDSDIVVSDDDDNETGKPKYELRPPSPGLTSDVAEVAKMGRIKGEKRGSDYIEAEKAEALAKEKENSKSNKKRKTSSADGTAKGTKGANKQKKWKEKEAAQQAQITGNGEAQGAFVWTEFVNEKGNKMTEIELEEVTFNPVACFVDPSDAHTGVDRNLKMLRPFMKNGIDQWKSVFSRRGLGPQKACKLKGAPNVIIVTHTAMGAADIYKDLKEFSQVCRVAKLFAKHIKVEEQIKYLQEHAVRIAVGTPNRISKLIEEGVLNLSNLTYVIVDSRKDIKNQNIFNVKQIKSDFLGELCPNHIFPLMKKNQTKMMLF